MWTTLAAKKILAERNAKMENYKIIRKPRNFKATQYSYRKGNHTFSPPQQHVSLPFSHATRLAKCISSKLIKYPFLAQLALIWC